MGENKVLRCKKGDFFLQKCVKKCKKRQKKPQLTNDQESVFEPLTSTSKAANATSRPTTHFINFGYSKQKLLHKPSNFPQNFHNEVKKTDTSSEKKKNLLKSHLSLIHLPHSKTQLTPQTNFLVSTLSFLLKSIYHPRLRERDVAKSHKVVESLVSNDILTCRECEPDRRLCMQSL